LSDSGNPTPETFFIAGALREVGELEVKKGVIS
jgi:hypothetical protein